MNIKKNFVELFSFKGRIPRKRYWLAILVGTFISLPGYHFLEFNECYQAKAQGLYTGDCKDFPTSEYYYSTKTQNDLMIREVLEIAGLWIAIFVGLAAHSKRFHDFGQSGWYTLLLLIPGGNVYVGIKCGFFKGNLGPNKYGADPLEKVLS